jgi:hypothetical protein
MARWNEIQNWFRFALGHAQPFYAPPTEAEQNIRLVPIGLVDKGLLLA